MDHTRRARIPILTDDYPLFRRRMSYAEWERGILDAVARADFTAVSLHDCYGDRWLPQYARLIDRLRELASPLTFDQVARRLALANAV